MTEIPPALELLLICITGSASNSQTRRLICKKKYQEKKPDLVDFPIMLTCYLGVKRF